MSKFKYKFIHINKLDLGTTFTLTNYVLPKNTLE